MIDVVLSWLIYTGTAALGFALGRWWRGRVRCPELTPIGRPDWSTQGYPLRTRLERCEQTDWHSGPCSISQGLAVPHYWHPEDTTKP